MPRLPIYEQYFAFGRGRAKKILKELYAMHDQLVENTIDKDEYHDSILVLSPLANIEDRLSVFLRNEESVINRTFSIKDLQKNENIYDLVILQHLHLYTGDQEKLLKRLSKICNKAFIYVKQHNIDNLSGHEGAQLKRYIKHGCFIDVQNVPDDLVEKSLETKFKFIARKNYDEDHYMYGFIRKSLETRQSRYSR